MIDILTKVLLILYTFGGASGLLCAPSCSNSTGPIVEGQKVANPSDCFEYYICSDVNGDHVFEISDESIRCPDGTFFNPGTKECKVIPTNGDPYCTNLCSPCAVACSSAGETVPDPTACEGYYVCLDGTPDNHVHVSCDPAGYIYDFTIRGCAPADTGRCFEECDTCKVYCVLEGRIPNPNNCKGYYYCEPPDQLAEFHCQEGDVYNAVKKECERSDIDCENSCNEGGSSTVSSTALLTGVSTTVALSTTATTTVPVHNFV